MIYVIVAGDWEYVKIGYSNSPLDRMQQLQLGNPLKLWIAAVRDGTKADEMLAHRRLSTWRMEGEWFDASCGFPMIAFATGVSISILKSATADTIIVPANAVNMRSGTLW